MLKQRLACLFAVLLLSVSAFASAHDARPKLVVIIVVDQMRGDYLERYRAKFGDGGFKLLMEKGANFTECYYDYVNLQTAPGHASISTGTYTENHGIPGNDWYDAATNKNVTSVEDPKTTIVGADGGVGASPRRLQAGTFADELRLATRGQSRVFGVSLKDRSAILPAGFSGNAAYWLHRQSGAFVTSTYYMKELPPWAARFNDQKRYDKYWDRDWKDAAGNVLARTPRTGVDRYKSFYDVVGATSFGNEYLLEFAKELVAEEKLGQGKTTDLLTVSFSSTDILGHRAGPNSPALDAMYLQFDTQLAEFIAFLGRQVGLANVWITLSSDHGITYFPDDIGKMNMPSGRIVADDLRAPLNAAIAKRLNRPAADYVKAIHNTFVYLSKKDFEDAGVKEEDAERIVGEEMMKFPGIVDYYTRAQIAAGKLRNDEFGRRTAKSFAQTMTWYVQFRKAPFITDYRKDISHGEPFSYDSHVPLLFYGLPFQAGTYRTPSEPIDMVVTLASLLGLNKPSHATGRVLVEALPAPKFDSRTTPQPEASPAKKR